MMEIKKILPLSLLLIGCQTTIPMAPIPTNRPLIIGHRGAAGERPEHTRASYRRAMETGADYIEPDLVCTKDRVLIARHENELSETTDVASKFPARKTKKTVDGNVIEGWFAEDLTLDEIRSLRAKERVASRDHSRDGQEEILTFDEILQLRESLSQEFRREVGIYPEMKHPLYLRSIGCDIEDKVAASLKRFHLENETSPVIVQSEAPQSLIRLRPMTKVRLMQLLDRDLTPAQWAQVKSYAQIVGPEKSVVLTTSVVQNAHKAGLLVHPWTFRSDAPFLNAKYQGNPALEYKEFLKLGVDGFFTDFPKDAVEALK